MAELADAQDSGSCGQYARGGSSPLCRTKKDKASRVLGSLFCFAFFAFGAKIVP